MPGGWIGPALRVTRPVSPLLGGEASGPNPTDRGKSGTKRHLVVERHGFPLAVMLSAADVNDCQMLEATLDAVPPIRGRCGRPRKRPKKLHADKGYDYAKCRQACRRRGITPRLARKGIESSQRLEPVMHFRDNEPADG